MRVDDAVDQLVHLLDDVGEYRGDHREFPAELPRTRGCNARIEGDDVGLHGDMSELLSNVALTLERRSLDAAHLLLIGERDFLQEFEQRRGLNNECIGLLATVRHARLETRHSLIRLSDKSLDALVCVASAEIEPMQGLRKYACQRTFAAHQVGVRSRKRGQAVLGNHQCGAIAV